MIFVPCFISVFFLTEDYVTVLIKFNKQQQQHLNIFVLFQQLKCKELPNYLIALKSILEKKIVVYLTSKLVYNLIYELLLLPDYFGPPIAKYLNYLTMIFISYYLLLRRLTELPNV